MEGGAAPTTGRTGRPEAEPPAPPPQSWPAPPAQRVAGGLHVRAGTGLQRKRTPALAVAAGEPAAAVSSGAAADGGRITRSAQWTAKWAARRPLQRPQQESRLARSRLQPSRALTRPRTKPAASITAPTVASGMLGPQPAAGPARCVTLRCTAAWCTRLGVGDAWMDQQTLDREMCACGHSHEATAAADEPPQRGRCRCHHLPSANEQLYKGSGNAFSRHQNQPVKGEWQVHEGLREDPG